MLTQRSIIKGLLALVLFCMPLPNIPGAMAADVFEGRKVYSQYCEGCHGPDGRGVLADVPDFTFGEGVMRSDFALLASIRDGKGVMPAYRGLLKEQEILNVIAYIRTLY